VVSDDDSLADRVRRALERDGLVVKLEAVERRPTVVVVGFHGHGRAEDAVRRARRLLPHAAVIAVLGAGATSDAGRLLALGADALLLDRDLEAAVAATVRGAAVGQVSVPGELRQLIQPAALSHRERQILGLAVAGLTNAQIAARLCVSESTVKSHLSSAFRRLGIHSRREAAALVFASDDVLRRSVLTTLRLSGVFAAGRDTP
jgi:DNA-binding NarL/FixJ family response regulator